MEHRVAKIIARSGVCSRRRAEDLIEQGRVSVDDQIINTPALKIDNPSRIKVDGKVLEYNKTRLWLYYKPIGLICSNNDEKNRKTIFDDLPVTLPRVVSVGRLDYNTEGLLLLTNDGELARFFELPKNAISREYKVKLFGKFNSQIIEKLQQGVIINGINYLPLELSLERSNALYHWVRVKIFEGKNREIRKIFQYFGFEVCRLIRVAYGNFKLGDLQPRQVIEVDEKQIDFIY